MINPGNNRVPWIDRYQIPALRPVGVNIGPIMFPTLPITDKFSEFCAPKMFLGAVLGSAGGFLMGLFLGAMGDNYVMEMIKGREVPRGPSHEQIRQSFKQTLIRSKDWAKSFAVISGMFTSVDCVVEKYRGRKDAWNGAVSGCITGAVVAVKQGPASMCFGCIGFAVFSAIMEKVMG